MLQSAAWQHVAQQFHSMLKDIELQISREATQSALELREGVRGS